MARKAKYFDTCERCGLEEEISESKPAFTVPVTIIISGEKGKKDLCPDCVSIVKAAFDKAEEKKSE